MINVPIKWTVIIVMLKTCKSMGRLTDCVTFKQRGRWTPENAASTTMHSLEGVHIIGQ